MNTSDKTKKIVYKRWNGKCALCGVSLPVEAHHIISKKDDPSLIDDPDNLVLVCRNHHALFHKRKPNGERFISFTDVEDLSCPRSGTNTKTGFYFDTPDFFKIVLGDNTFEKCSRILTVQNRPLIEIWPCKPVQYSDKKRYYIFIRFFDRNDKLVGAMFANHWIQVLNEDWNLDFSPGIKIEAYHKNKGIFIKIERKDNLIVITGRLYFKGNEIEINDSGLFLSNSKIIGSDFSGVGLSVNN
ncbi:HNH endonuclease [Patescibacteria group bacterium]